MIYEVKNNFGEIKQVSMSLAERTKYSIMDDAGRDIYVTEGDRVWFFVPPVLEQYRLFAEARNVEKSKRN